MKAIGVSNCTAYKLNELIEKCDDVGIPRPQLNQCEIHPYLQQPKLVEFCKQNGVILGASMPLGSPERPARWKRDDDPVVMGICRHITFFFFFSLFCFVFFFFCKFVFFL